jgi:uncharacterized repeat protein (TIGR01451 family)/uncharacterized delta-60 repeat protein
MKARAQDQDEKRLDVMFTLHNKILKRAGGLFMPLWLAMAFYAATAMDVHAQPAPPNDTLTNAQVIFGISGTVYGTNLYVPLQTTAPAQDPFPEQYSIWYVWTAPITGMFDFNTRDSTDINGNPLDTVLAVYTLTSGANVSLTNLTLVAANENDPNTAYAGTSRVDFSATLGTVYFIQVDGSQENSPGTNAQGYITLNWGASLVAGGFGFSSTCFPFSSLEDYLIDNNGSITPSIYGHSQGANNSRITVTRNGAFTGRCEMTLIVTNAMYTNIYYTNYIITNLFITNYTSNQVQSSWTNIFITNTWSLNEFANDEYGVINYLPLDAETIVAVTNSSVPLFPYSNYINVVLGTNASPFFLEYFQCPAVPWSTNFPITNGNGSFGEYDFYTNSSGMVSNSDGSWTATVTNIICISDLSTNVVVPAAINGIHYNAGSYTVTFNDFQMSQDVYLEVDPPLANYPGDLARQDCLIPGPEDYYYFKNCTELEFLNTDPNYIYSGLNASVELILTNAVLDANELQDIVPPTISQTNADLNILNYYGTPTPIYTNNGGNQVVMNFEREDFRVNRDAGVAVLWVQTYPRYRATSYTLHYTIDSKNENGDVIDWDNWATVAGADYAVPFAGQAVYDFTLPTNSGWSGWDGMLTFPEAPDDSAQPIYIPINNNGSQEFDEDIYVQLGQTESDYTSDSGATPPAYLGNIYNVHLTINFDNTGDNLQPGGAVDRNWNVDSESTSVPPGNPLPGANGGEGAAVQAVAIQANGEAIIGGYFDSYNDTNVYGIARLLANGFLDTSFNTGTGINNGFVDALAIDSTGRVIVGGSFASINNNITASNIARLNYNGSADTSFNSGVGFNGTVYALSIDANGDILAGGDFTSYNTTNCNHIARLLPGGGLDANFLPNTGNGLTNYGTDGDVWAVATDGNGNIILGGQFIHVNGSNMNYVARLLPSGALDTTFNPEIGPDDTVYSVAIETNNNEIFIGGAFQNYRLVSRSSIALIATDGSLDTTFNPGTGADGPIYSVVVQPDGNVLIGGQFTSFNTTRRIGLARLLPQGWLDTSFMDTAYNQFAGFINPYYNDTPNTIYALGLEASGNIIAGGSFTNGVGGGFTRADVHYRANVAQIIGASTVGYGSATLTYETGGIGNCPGNITFTQNPYEALDTQSGLYVTLQRTNGSLGPATVTLGTNLLAPGPGDATAADFSLDKKTATYLDLWDLTKNPAAGSYGWRKSDGFSGFNNLIGDQGNSGLSLYIYNDLTAGGNLYADLSLLNVNSYGLLSLGGVPIPTGPALGLPGSQLEILDNNLPVGIVGYSATNYTTVNTTNNITITVLRTNGSSGVISIYYWTKDGTARAAAGDYTPTHGKLTFNAGVGVQTFPVTIGNFTNAQPTKSFNLLFSNASPANILDPSMLPTNATVTIIDGSFLPGHLSFTSPTYSVLKGGVAAVGVMRSGGALGELTVQCGTSNGSAINGLNYTGVTNTLSWSNQDVSVKTMTFQTLQDNTIDGNLTNTVFLFNATNIGGTATSSQILTNPSSAIVTIDEVNSYGALSFVADNFNIMQNANQAVITVIRSSGATGTISVNYTNFGDASATNLGTNYQPAVAGTNFGMTSGTLTFGPGVPSESFVVPIYYTPNETNKANRMVTLELLNGSPAAITNQNTFPIIATLTILDPQLVLNPAGNVDTTTENGTGFNNDVNSLALQPDGSILAGGDFTFFNQYPFEYVARLIPNGDYDSSFLANQVGAGANNSVLQVLSQTTNSSQTNDGPIVIVGGFTQVNSVWQNGIARLNVNGSLDTSFNPGSGADSTIYAIAETSLPAGITNQPRTLAYYIGGSFANFDGVHCGGIARLNASTNSPGAQGTVDPNFNVGEGVTGSDAVVHALAVQQANGQVILGGDFTAFNGVPYNHLIRLNVDGSVDTSFNPSTNFGPADSVRAIAIQPDGQILIGGLFTNVGGSNLNYLARLNSADGSVDTNFNVGVGGNNDVLALAIDSQNRILVGGEFTRFSGVTRNGITRLNPDGTVDPTINFGTGADGGFVDAIVIQSNDEIDVGGGFSTFEGIAENNFVRLFGGANYGDGSVEFSQAVYGVLESGTNAVITLERLGGEGTNALTISSIKFSTSDGTALAGTNYTAVSTNVIFPLGETFETVTIPILNNDQVGSNMIVNLNLSDPTNLAIGVQQASAILIITNANSEVSFLSQTYDESENVSGGNAIISVVRIGNRNSTVGMTVYTGTNGTATPNVDYTPTTNFIVFNPGVMTNYFLVPMLNASNMLSNATVNLEMSDPSNTFIGPPSSAILTIDGKNGPGVMSFSQPSYSIVAPSAGETNAIITIVESENLSNTVSVTLTTSNGTAIAGIDYASVVQPNTFSGPGNDFVYIPVYAQPDAGPATTVYLTLSNPQGGATIGGAAQEILTILNGIEGFSFTNSPYFVGEGAGTVTLEIVRSGPMTNAASVSYSTFSPPNASEADGYAVPYVDYVPASGTLSFASNETFTTIPITIIQGDAVNGPLTFEVVLNNPSPAGVQIGVPGTASVTILSDVTGFEFSTNAYAVGENGSNIVITVNRLNPATGVASVQYATSDGTNTLNPALNASNKVDYVSTNGTLTFQNGQATNSFIVPIINQNIVEGSKTFNVTLSNPLVTVPNSSWTNAYLESPSTATVTITNVLAGVSFGSPTYTVSECGVTAAIPVVLTGVTNGLVSIVCSTTNGGSASPGTNYFPAITNFTFQPGQTSTNFYVQVINNHVIGPNHTVFLALSNPEGALLLNPSTAVLTIQECNGAYIVNSGTAFVWGSVPNNGGVILPNETVTVLFGLRDVAGSNATNLVATLQATNGVVPIPAGESQTYPLLIANGPTVSMPFTFEAVGTNGQNISADLVLTEGTNIFTNYFGLTLGGIITTFSTNETLLLNGSMPIPSKAYNTNPPNYGYPSLINVSGVQGNVTAVTAGISNFGHTYPSYVDVVLEGPGGQDTYLMYGCGSDISVQHLNFTFSQSAGSSLPASSALSNGTYLPTVYGDSLSLPTNGPSQPQAPLQPFQTNLNTFAGLSPNGTWSLFVAYDDQLDSGYISNGWSLSFSTGIPVESDSDLELAITAPASATQGATLTYSISVSNAGPAAATNVIITDTLPSGVSYVTNSTNWVGTNGVLTSTPTNLAVGSNVTFTIEVIPDDLGYITNIAAATANQPDPNINNVQTNVVLVSAPSADLGVTLSGSQNPVPDGANVTYAIVVTNNGPSTATNVTAINVLPAGFRPGTITPAPLSVVTNASGTVSITWNVGAMGSGSYATLTIVAGVNLPEKTVTNLDSVTVSSPVYDPAKLNNYASVKTLVVPATINVAGSGTNYSLSWQAAAGNIMLEGAVSLSGPWVPIANPATMSELNGLFFYTYILPGTNGYHFFRLKSQLP